MSESAIDFTPAEAPALALDFTPAAPAEPDPAAGAAYMAETSTISPQAAAEAIPLASEMGAGYSYVAENLDAVKAQRAQDRTAEHLRRAPALAEYMAQSPAHAALVKPDVPVLSMLGEALQLGFVDLGAALEGNRQAKEGAQRLPHEQAPGLTAAEEEHLAFVEGVQGAGVAGADSLPSKVAVEITRASPTMAAFTSAALAGAAVGSLAGPIGAAAGGLIGAGIAAYSLNFGPLYRRLRGLADDQGNVLLTDEEAKTGAAAGSTLVAAVQTLPMAHFLRAAPGVSAALQKVGLDAATKATTSTVGRAALARLADYGGHVVAGAVAMAGQSAVNAVTVELEKQQNGVEPDWGAVTHAAADGFTSGLMLAPLAAFGPGRDFLHDVGRIHNARLEAFSLDAYAAMAKDLSKASPEETARIVDSMAKDGNAQTVYVDHEALLKQPDAVAKVSPEALTEAVATKGDVPVPIGEYLTKLGDQHQALREDVKLSPDGMTLREADQVQNGPLARALAEKQQAMNLPDGPERTAAVHAAHEKMLDVVAAQYNGTPAEWNGVLKEPATLNGMGAGLGVKPVETVKPPPSARILGDYATRATEAKRLGDLTPGRRRQAADNAAKKAAEAGAKVAIAGAEGTPTGPGRSLNKLQEIAEFENARDLNTALAKAETAALKEADGHRKFLLSFTQDAQRGELGKAGPGYQEQVDRLLSGFELGQGASRTEVARRLATMEWVAGEQAQGRTPVIPDSVMAKLDRFVHWKEMTPQEMRDLRNAVESIAHQAHLKNTILANNKRVEAVQAKSAIVDAAFTNIGEHPTYQEGDVVPIRQAAADLTRRAGAVVIRPEEYVRRIDAGNINGPMSTNFWHPLSESYNTFLKLERKWSQPIRDAIKNMAPEVKKRWRSETFTIAGKERTMEQAIVVALNSMNPSNRGKLERGYSGVEHLGIQSWTSDHIEQFLSKLGRPEWQFVQTVVDSLEAAWPEISAHEQRLSGIAPEKVQAGQPFTRTLADGTTITIRPGYYPVIYDPKFPGRRQSAQDALFAANYTTAKTPQGRLNSRIEEYARPIALTLNGLPRVIREFAKDTAMREAVVSAHSVITDPTVANALDRTIGAAGRRVLESAVRDSANDMALPGNGAELALEFLATLRGGVSASIFSWNIGQYLQNYSGIVQTLKHVPPSFVKGAMGQLLTDHGAFIDGNRGESKEMATRGDHANADTALAIRKLHGEGTGRVAELSEMGMRFWASSDTLVSQLTYGGARDHAMAPVERGGLGYDPQSAIRYAERTVRLALGSGRTLDLPAFLRHPVLKQFAPFQGWTSAMFNDYLASGYNARKFWQQGEYGHALKEFQGTIMAATLLGLTSSLLVLKGPKDKQNDGLDPVDIARWIAVEGILQPTQWIPYFGQPLKAVAEGEKLRFSLFVPPAGRPIEAAANALAAVHGAAQKRDVTIEDFGKLGLKGLEALATAKGLPVVQLRNTAGYLLDQNQPKDNALQVGLGIAGGKKRPGKLLNLAE